MAFPEQGQAVHHASVDDPRAVADLLRALRETGPDHAVARLLAGDPAGHVQLDDLRSVAHLLRALRAIGADDAARVLAIRAVGRVSLDATGGVADLLPALHETEASDAGRTLAERAPDAGMFDIFLECCPDEASIYRFGREPDRPPSQPWTWQEPPTEA